MIKLERSFASYWVIKVQPKVWLDAMRARDVDIDSAQKHLLARVVNENTLEGFDEVDTITRDAILEQMESDGFVTVFQTFGGAHVDATTKGKRLAREL